MVTAAVTEQILCNVVTVANDDVGDLAATGLRTGADGPDAVFVGADTVPSFATKVQVVGQLIAEMHLQINGTVMVVSPVS